MIPYMTFFEVFHFGPILSFARGRHCVENGSGEVNGRSHEENELPFFRGLEKWNVMKKLVKFSGIWGQFHQHSTSSFNARRSQKRKKDRQVKQIFCAFGICGHKSCS